MNRSQRLLLTLTGTVGLLMAVSASSALAETAPPVWKVVAVSTPTNFRPGDKSETNSLIVTATNVSNSAAGCTLADYESERAARLVPVCPSNSPVANPIVVSDVLPKGLTAVRVQGHDSYHEAVASGYVGEGLSCTQSQTVPSCSDSNCVDPGDTLILTIQVDVETTTEGSGEVNQAAVVGGGAASVSVSEPVTISSAPAKYGVAAGGLFGAMSTNQAGGHPNVTNVFFLNTINKEDAEESGKSIIKDFDSEAVEDPKDIRFDLPPGLVGTTVGMARCTMAEVANYSSCPQNTMVGTATLIVFNAHGGGRIEMTVPIFNIAPSPGEPAAFAFNALFYPVRLDTSVLSDGEYNVRVSAPDLTQGAADYMSAITIWGVPAEHSSPGPDVAAKNLGASIEEPQFTFGDPSVEEYSTSGGLNKDKVEGVLPVALLTNPSQCSAPLTGVLETDAWEEPDPHVFSSEATGMGTLTGCNLLSFDPGVSMLPDSLEAGAPAGYSFALRLPQNVEPGGLATPDVRRTSVTLPAGTVISPSAADGLGACSGEQFDLHSGTPGSCPRDSQVGTVRSKTPALEEALTGEVFLASPLCDPCSPADAADGRMVRLFLQLVGEGESGIVVKQELTGEIDQQTGQLTVTDAEVPQVPFSELKLTLQGGERATLANPRSCGPETTTAELEPWSTPYTPNADPTSSFDIDENCFGPQFNPSFSAGTTSNQAGGFSPFTLSFGRGDDDEFLNGIQLQMPAGMLGMLSKVKLCGEPQAAEGTCGPESLVGETSVETGPGADPFLVTGGKVYITEGYKGAPYGLSIVVPATAGPYTLAGTTGKGTVVVRSAISVNPRSAALTVTSDPLPTELDGIPLQLRLVNVTVGTNTDFTFNATSCDKTAVTGVMTSVADAVATDSSSYQVTNCAALKFQPKLSVSTAGKASKANGASLFFKISYPKTEIGGDAWFKEAKFDLPKQLPARLTTLQKACLASVFEANPAACPHASMIGEARVHTPVLPVALMGPVYFVSYGNAKFPEAVVVLQGYGVSVDLHGETFISKEGVTSATFRNTPDVPFESIEVSVPTGAYSEFGANLPAKDHYNFCGQTLKMPTLFIAQNGAEIHQETPVTVTGCAKAKAASKKKKAKKASNKKAKKASSEQQVGSARDAGYEHGRNS